MCGVASTWPVMPSAPALANAVDVALRPVDHQVDVEHRARGVDLLGERLDDQRAHGDRRDEVAVHDVDVDDRRAGVEHVAHLLAQAGEVGGEDRGGDAGRRPLISARASRPGSGRTGTCAVLDMRTIVECSPQFGHTERSSKRSCSSRSGSGRAGSSGAATARGSPGTPARGRPPSSLTAPPQPRDEEAVGAVAVREGLEDAGHASDGPRRAGRTAGRRREVGVRAEERGHDASFSAGEIVHVE